MKNELLEPYKEVYGGDVDSDLRWLSWPTFKEIYNEPVVFYGVDRGGLRLVRGSHTFQTSCLKRLTSSYHFLVFARVGSTLPRENEHEYGDRQRVCDSIMGTP